MAMMQPPPVRHLVIVLVVAAVPTMLFPEEY